MDDEAHSSAEDSGGSLAKDGANPPEPRHRTRSRWARPGWPLALGCLVVIGAVGAGGIAIGRSGPSGSSRDPAVLDAVRSGVARNATITVTGSGTVQGTPDTVSFQIGVQTTAASAASALSENDSEVTSLETTLSRHHVTTPDMQTSGLSINANTSHGVVTGFTVDDDLNVSMHDIAQAGAAIDSAADAVGNGIQLYGISFSIANQSSLLASARAKAMENARIEAAQLASGAGTALGGIVKVNDQESTSPLPFAANMAKYAAGVPIEIGSQPVTVQVTVVYALR